MIAVIVKPFDGYTRGQVVDASGWRNATRMLATRILRAATPDELIAFKKAKKTEAA